jgi:uncharacterized membrane protein
MSVDQPTPRAAADESKLMATVVYVLFLLSLPSFGTLMVVGAVLAYVARDKAPAWVRTHLDKEIRLFWITLIWTIGLGVAFAISSILVFALIGIPMLGLVWVVGVVVALWFHVVSFIGLMRLLQDKPAS